MAFDAGMLSAVVHELNNEILGSKIDKIYQPGKEEIIFVLRRDRDSVKLLVSAAANTPRINLTRLSLENPKTPPAFCQLLRKHLQSAKIIAVRQQGFERALEIEFEAHDEMSFKVKKFIIAEIMGKYSNIMLCNEDKKILSAIKLVDFTTSQKRQVLPGMIYEAPPSQNKKSPLEVTEEEFKEAYRAKKLSPEKFITNEYMGISSLVAREIALGTEGNTDRLWRNFKGVIDIIRNNQFVPILIRDLEGNPFEYSFVPITQYKSSAKSEREDSFGELIDSYFATREHVDRIKQKANDILKLLSAAETRLLKKISLQEADMAACGEKETLKLFGDLITSNIYKLERGMESAILTDYYSEEMKDVKVALDSRLNPSQNAQRYYKKYNKLKKAETELTRQIEIAKSDLDYIYSVFESLAKAENENDLNEIRRELYESGFASRMKNYTAQKIQPAKPLEFKTDGGYRVLCGKNNTQNDFITFRLASKGDYWFHVKNSPGSHVVMITDGEEPSESDFTQAAAIAAVYSKVNDGQNVAVDYTLVKNVKKPGGSKPGFVIYHTNWTAYVNPDKELVNRLKK